MHRRLDFKIENDNDSMELEDSVISETSEENELNDQNNIANMVINLFNKKVR